MRVKTNYWSRKMKKHLQNKTLSFIAVSSILSGCGGVDSGLDYNFKSDNVVEFPAESLSATYDEQSGMQEFDLLQGATVNGNSLSTDTGQVFVREFLFQPQNAEFVTPQSPGAIASQAISPFKVKDYNKLVIDTDMFAEALRSCDTTDVRGAKDADGNNIGNGVRDFPESITYTITYVIDNGAELPIGETLAKRTMTLTINAKEDVVTGVNLAATEVPAGGTVETIASTLPAYACNSAVNYTVADTSIATVDADGVVTGVKKGETTLTVTSIGNPEKTVTAALSVTAGFSLAITNSEVDEFGAPTGKKVVPACVSAGITVQPSVINDELAGSYVYDWTSSNDVAMPFSSSQSLGFGATGLFQTGSTVDAIGTTTTVSVNLGQGDTGATDINEVAGKSIDLTVGPNLVCDPGISAHPAGFNTDFKLDVTGAPWTLGAVAASTDALSGNSLEITSGAGEFTQVAQIVWNKQRNWTSATYGLGAPSVGKAYKYSVWVKLPTLPTADITLKHMVLAYAYEGGPTGPGYEPRRPGAGVLSAHLAKTTEWQLVEFINEATGTNEWSVPLEWNIVTDVFQFWEVYGLPEGEKILLDEYAVIPVE
jgi:hypothetical protein